MTRRFVIAVALIALLGVQSLLAATLFERGEKLFMENKPREAAPLLENALSQEPDNEKIYLYLGYIYEQLGEHEEAVDILQRGVEVADERVAAMYYNLANNLRALDRFDEAETMYTKAVQADSGFSKVYLNRANLQVQQEDFEEAIDDYTVYLNLEPASSQRGEIERLIALLEQKAEEKAVREAEEERRRRVAEERRRAEEERQRREAEERRKALLGSVLDSLGSAGEETENLSGGSEDIREEEEEVDIID
ncbi:MAG: tetratricopeptide repeat protein [Spirochaetaceae bacterium]